MSTLTPPSWLTTVTFCGLTPLQWTSAVIIAAVTYPVLDGLRRWAMCKLSAAASRTAREDGPHETDVAPIAATSEPKARLSLTDIVVALLDDTRRPMMMAVAVLTGLSAVATSQGDIANGVLTWAQRGWQTVMLLQCALWASRAVGLLSHRYLERHRTQRAALALAAAQAAARATDSRTLGPDGARTAPVTPQPSIGLDSDDGINPVIVRVLAWSVRTVMWALFLLSLMAQGGVNITAFVASLSIGAAAIGFAVHGVLSDLFASLAIGLDKPFRIGDFIAFGDVSGTIEQVGMKTTRIRSLRGEEIICGNTELLRQQIHNFQRMQTRRIVFRFSLAYATPATGLRAVPAMVEQAFAQIPHTRCDRVHFAAFAERGLEFEVVYYVTRPDYATYMDCQQALNLAIVDGLAAFGIAFAQPIREIRMVDAAINVPRSPTSDQLPATAM
ncbi:mechanosensitive ion channel family protein [Robbsia andropogonis]|uniref:mechanosensitive ion channel family protein n=1 Tax=Robbsia andropogonis TaxID=28092 RepID=UPI003D24FC7B